MKKKRLIKIFIWIIFVVFFIIVVKSNVTFSKEISGLDSSGMVLEINSDLVQNIYAQLTLLDDSIGNPEYDSIYFEREDEKLSLEEVIYMSVEDAFNRENTQEEKTIFTMKTEDIREEVSKYFNSISIDKDHLSNIVSPDCGITAVNEKDDNEYVFTIKKCSSSEKKNYTELESARKLANSVILRLKAFYALYEKRDSKEKEGHYLLKNYNQKDYLARVKESKFTKPEDFIEDDTLINRYDFYFELNGEHYRLDKIVRVN